MAEELARDRGLGERGAVDRDEGALAPGRELVDHLRQVVLAGAGLPVDEDGRLGGRHAPHQLEDRDQLGRRGDQGQPAADPLAQPHDLGSQRAPLVGPLHRHPQPARLERPHQVAVGAGARRRQRRRALPLAAEHQHRGLASAGPQRLDEVGPGAARRRHVDQRHRRPEAGGQREGPVGGGALGGVEAELPKLGPERGSGPWVAIDDEDARGFHGVQGHSAAHRAASCVPRRLGPFRVTCAHSLRMTQFGRKNDAPSGA